jgi:hypothetical protein
MMVLSGLGCISAAANSHRRGQERDERPARPDREDSELGRRYIAAMELAGGYAYAGARVRWWSECVGAWKMA